MRWLILPQEERELRRLRSDAEAARFVAEFWRRRDPDPESPDNPFRERFEQRAQAADRQYAEEGIRGSLTDRGRALVLLGPPSRLRHGRHAAPAWRPARARGAAMPVRYLVVESWEYLPEELPPPLAAMLDDAGEPAVVLTFVLGERARLIDGDKFLEMAAQAAVRLAP